MLAARNYSATAVHAAVATGITALDQTAAAFSWGAWVRQISTAVGTYIWAHTNDAATPRNGVFVFLSTRGAINLGCPASGASSVSSIDGFVPFGRWVHVGVMYDGAGVFFYRNGKLQQRVAYTQAPAVSGTRRTAVGNDAGGTSPLRCEVWDIRVFRALALAHSQMATLCDPTAVVPACSQRLFYERNWRMAGTGAVTVPDESGNGRDLTSASTTSACDVANAPDWRRILARRGPYRFAGAVASASSYKSYHLYW